MRNTEATLLKQLITVSPGSILAPDTVDCFIGFGRHGFDELLELLRFDRRILKAVEVTLSGTFIVSFFKLSEITISLNPQNAVVIN
ncbi:hypothetical protein P0136_10130 [Lentisphaerota bacterium ZTH]|nr:hypothetical protein JYG24_12360 [Lentisphaerota bacterium]WET05718.1 hypothetical protein P0136_10130 [Lentisphaerota bacterium ZTH]